MNRSLSPKKKDFASLSHDLSSRTTPIEIRLNAHLHHSLNPIIYTYHATLHTGHDFDFRFSVFRDFHCDFKTFTFFLLERSVGRSAMTKCQPKRIETENETRIIYGAISTYSLFCFLFFSPFFFFLFQFP